MIFTTLPTYTMITTIPFDGFYESYSSEKIEEVLGISDNDYYSWNQENPKGEEETDEQYSDRRDAYFDKIRDESDYLAIKQEYCKAYVDAFAEDNGIALTYESLSSPREYNFTTDRIFCEITPEEVKRLVSLLDREKFAEYVKENFTSCDGFSSFYSNNADEWKIDDTESLDHNQIGAIIECLTAEHIAERNKNYPYIAELMEDFYR